MLMFKMSTEPAAPAGAASESTEKNSPDTLRGGHVAAAASPTSTNARDGTVRKLVVGNEIVLSGKISSCDCLVVQGSVAADIANCRQLDIARTGTFTGTATVDNADIDGCFDGQLTVTGRLLVRTSGLVKGAVRYGELVIERGGRLSGEIKLWESHASEKIVPVLARNAAGSR
jgi:cytoskeletal protein CcmA (bactofilin family)